MRLCALSVFLVLAATPTVHAQTAPAVPQAVEGDAARLAVARSIVVRQMPPGTYRKMMGSTMDMAWRSAMDGMMRKPIGELAAAMGMAGPGGRMDETSMAEIMAVLDPHFAERNERGAKAVLASMLDYMSDFEPRMREALARAYAGRFALPQLREIDRFLSTPTGSAYAGSLMTIANDPEMQKALQAMMADMPNQSLAWAGAAIKATADLPPPRKYSDLTKAERDKLAALLSAGKE